MSAAIPVQTCSTTCPPVANVNIPGPEGPAGPDGAMGVDGQNAFTFLVDSFTMPPEGGTVEAEVDNSDWATPNQVVYVQNAGYMQVQAKADSTHVTLLNLENTALGLYTSNVPAGTVVPAFSYVSPAGIQGPTGAAGTTDLNFIAPTTTKGDLMVDGGANSPAADVQRFAVGTDGQLPAADSTQPLGIGYKTLLPNAGTDNAILALNGAAGTPIPAQERLLIITDDGAIQSTPTGGNARGGRAVDLQTERTGVTMVASGANSVITGGKNNTASATDSHVGGGSMNTASGADSTVGAGVSNTASGANACVAGGTGNTASDIDAFVGGGNTNVASAQDAGVICGVGNVASGGEAFIGGGNGNLASGGDAVISGGESNIASGIYSSVPGGNAANANQYGQVAHASGAFTTQGDAQASEVIFRGSTANATQTEIFLDGAATRLTVPNNTSWGFEIMCVARRSDGTSAVLTSIGGIKNDAGVVVVIAAVAASTVVADGSAGAIVAGSLVVDADDPNNSLRVRVTGVIAESWRWCARCRLVELGF